MNLGLSLSLGSSRPVQGGGVILFDDFARADTADGSLGSTPTGQPWTLRGPYAGSYPLPPSAFGKITDGAYVVPGGQIVYAFVTAPQTPRSLEVDWSWLDDGAGTQFTTLAVILSSSANGIDTMLHITITNGVCRIEKRVSGGAFVLLNTGATTISPSLALASTLHKLRIDVAGETVRVRIDDTRYDVTVTDAAIPTIVGPTVVVEHYSATTDVRWPMRVRRVEARA